MSQIGDRGDRAGEAVPDGGGFPVASGSEDDRVVDASGDDGSDADGPGTEGPAGARVAVQYEAVRCSCVVPAGTV